MKVPLLLSNSRLKLATLIKLIAFLSVSLSLSACYTSQQIRTEHIQGNCLWDEIDCSTSIIQQYPEYDLTFLEFTERGNLFDRQHANQVFTYINEVANTDRGAAVFVFAHGWKHNARERDSNVQQFRSFLERAAENEVVGKRKVIGVFLGWRGDVSSFPWLRNLSYWSRKSVAEEIGQGGATEVLTQLHQILVAQFDEQQNAGPLYRNTYVVIGHSFGGAIVLSAIHDVLLKELIAARPVSQMQGVVECKKVKRFADALVLLNPAIEANKVIQLREAASRCQFNSNQPNLMHVLSSEGDNATRIYFPLGQAINLTKTLTPKRLKRTVNNKPVILDEGQLNISTIGNLDQIRTGYLFYDDKVSNWRYQRCRDDLKACGIRSVRDQRNHIPVASNDPLVFLKTDRKFIKNHNDVFGCYVQSYITAIIFETQSVDKGYINNPALANSFQSDRNQGCDHKSFSFQRCFSNQLSDYDCEVP